MRRRRADPSSSSSTANRRQSSASSADGTVAPAAGAAAASSNPPSGRPNNTVEQVLDEEDKSFSQFLSLCAVVALIFIYMIRSTQLPPPRRVYAVMIDAGSTGTRAQVFKFIYDQQRDALVLNATHMHTIKKSISALGTGVGGTGPQFFRPLLDKIKKTIPGIRRRQRTPVALRATAGLRLLGADAAQLALKHASEALNTSEFLFDPSYVSVLSGRQEAIYGWTSVNHLLGRLDPTTAPNTKFVPPVATLELGGGSMQIVHVEETPDESASGDGAGGITTSASHSINMFGRTHSLRTAHFLGLGLVEYTKRLYSTFESEGVLEEGNPCYRRRVYTDKTIAIGFGPEETVKQVTIHGDGDFKRCVASAEIVIAHTVSNRDGVGKLPPGTTAYAYAFFYDRTVGAGLGKEPSKDELVAKGVQLCESSSNNDSENDENSAGEFEEACAQFSYVYAIIKALTDNFSKERGVKIRFEQFVDGHMLGWALGAVLDVVQPVMHQQISLDTESLTIS